MKSVKKRLCCMIFAIELLAEPVLAPVDVFSIVIISYTTES